MVQAMTNQTLIDAPPIKPFLIGDVVALRSGGPLMNVEFCLLNKGRYLVHVIWFNGKRVRRDVFDPESLQRWKVVDHD